MLRGESSTSNRHLGQTSEGFARVFRGFQDRGRRTTTFPGRNRRERKSARDAGRAAASSALQRRHSAKNAPWGGRCKKGPFGDRSAPRRRLRASPGERAGAKRYFGGPCHPRLRGLAIGTGLRAYRGRGGAAGCAAGASEPGVNGRRVGARGPNLRDGCHRDFQLLLSFRCFEPDLERGGFSNWANHADPVGFFRQ